MPILDAEPDLYPHDLLDRTDWTTDDERCWWALYTRSRCEKELMRRLRALDIAHYGPIIEKRGRTPKGRITTSFVPLFANYVFLYGDAQQRYQALTTNCISRDLVVNDGAELAADLRQLRRLIATGAPITPEARLEPGARVRVRSGPLEGQEGIVVQRRGETRLLVAVRFLQQGATVQIDDCQVEKI
ncbi:MAG: UpxY family transcription antiterminator [Planctomycetia bacterium]|nr:UpxY family transcription antiterminator [Planctomycetia bacterium]